MYNYLGLLWRNKTVGGLLLWYLRNQSLEILYQPLPSILLDLNDNNKVQHRISYILNSPNAAIMRVGMLRWAIHLFNRCS